MIMNDWWTIKKMHGVFNGGNLRNSHFLNQFWLMDEICMEIFGPLSPFFRYFPSFFYFMIGLTSKNEDRLKYNLIQTIYSKNN
jgi:hypothetical protein